MAATITEFTTDQDWAYTNVAATASGDTVTQQLNSPCKTYTLQVTNPAVTSTGAVATISGSLDGTNKFTLGTITPGTSLSATTQVVDKPSRFLIIDFTPTAGAGMTVQVLAVKH